MEPLAFSKTSPSVKKLSTLSFALKKKKPIALVPRIPLRERTYQALQSWEGFVLEKFDDHFMARITDLNNEQMDEEVEICHSPGSNCWSYRSWLSRF